MPDDDLDLSKSHLVTKPGTSMMDPISNVILNQYKVGAQGKGKNWDKASTEITPPKGWRTAIATLSGFRAQYRDGDQHIRQVGIQVYLSLASDGKLRLTIHGLLRDNDAKEVSQVAAIATVMFLISSP